jgi:hypothetical protein
MVKEKYIIKNEENFVYLIENKIEEKKDKSYIHFLMDCSYFWSIIK